MAQVKTLSDWYQVANLYGYYESEGRPDTSRNLEAALQAAENRVESNPASGLSAPRPYPTLAQPGQAWIKAGSYGLRYSTGPAAAITGVFYDRASIPSRS